MAEYTRGQEGRREGHSGHNTANEERTRRETQGLDFEGMNFEQRRAPYGFGGRNDNSAFDNTGNEYSSDRRENL